MVRIRSASAAASAATPRSGLAAAITGRSARRSASMTPFQLEDSAKAPWTRTMVGCMLGSFRGARSVLSRHAGRERAAIDEQVLAVPGASAVPGEPHGGGDLGGFAEAPSREA